MDSKFVLGKINEYLHQATDLLADWLNNMLPKVTDNWWNECVLLKLSYNQRNLADEKHFTKLTDFDLSALLRIADKNWYAMREFAYLPTKERECIRDMVSVRNNWAHCGVELPGKDSIVHDISVLQAFFEQMNSSYDFLRKIENFKKEIEESSFAQEKSPTGNPSMDFNIESDTSSEIKEKDMVYLTGDPSVKGMVFSVEKKENTTKYEVFVDGALKIYYTGQICLVDNKPKYNWVDIATFQSSLSAYQINNPSSGNLYSLNSARIDFVPYQFRPALKLIKSDEPRILIADSVGVGKTIEAGLIIKELEARNELENVMIICPKPLVTERKWELEMKRFDEEFVPLNGAELRQIISDTDRDGEWPTRYGKTIVPYSILDSRVYNGDESKRGKNFGLVDLDPAPHFDLVIIDEAHNIRNGSMEKEKAFAYKCVKYFCDHADAVVMLTATPLQTSDDDLFTLLNLLRPDIVIDKDTFRLMSKPNAYISRCSQIIRTASDNWQSEAIDELENILTTQWGENVVANNPTYPQVINQLRKENISHEERVKLITDVESLHSFNTMLNRTRRKDIQDFCIRRSHTIETTFTDIQKELHDELLRFEKVALSTMHDVRSVPFMMSTIRRQASSCIFGLAPHIKDLINRRFEQMVDYPEFDIDKTQDYGELSMPLAKLAKRVLELADNLPEDDPKFDSVLKIIKQKQECENNKIIIFSTFRHTLAYIKKKLVTNGFRVEQIDGSVKDDTRCAYRERFMKDKSEEDAIDILLFTEVGSEGLDYQFCNMMINYDLPWNPMRIEQRIGRIDRRGQKSEVVNIYNIITSGTVDADIYTRCLMRIGVFERSIGECEEILGEIGSQIEKIATDTNLTDEERKYKLQQMADNEIRKLQELSKLEDDEKSLFGFDLSNYTTAKEIQEAESPWLTPRSLSYLVQNYLQKRLGEGVYIIGESDIKTLRLSATKRSILREDFKKLPNIRSSALKRKWENYLKGTVPTHSITFESEAASENHEAFFITPVHPLVKQAAKYFATDEKVYISVQTYSDDIPSGEYPFSVYAWNYLGINPHFKLVAVCENDAISKEWVELLLSAQSVEQTVSNDDAWSLLESKQIDMWLTEKQAHLNEAKKLAEYKSESLTDNYKIQKRNLEQKIQDAFEPNIKRMRQSQLNDITEKYNAKSAEIEQKLKQADIQVELIANGIINVK